MCGLKTAPVLQVGVHLALKCNVNVKYLNAPQLYPDPIVIGLLCVFIILRVPRKYYEHG